MKRLLICGAIVLSYVAESGAAEYICKLPGGKTSIQGSPCTNDAKTTYQNTRPYESQEEMRDRVRDADRRVAEPMRRELATQEAEREEARRKQRDEENKKAIAAQEQSRIANEQAKEREKLAREQALLDEVRAAREAAEAAKAEAKRAANSGGSSSGGRMTCYQNGPFMNCR